MSKKSTRIAVYPGSFDPITLGHVDIIERVAKVFDHVIVLVAKSSDKQGLFSPEERVELIAKTLAHLKNVSIDVHEGLTVDYLHAKNATILVRGLRAIVDFEYEISMANMNNTLAPEIETLLMFARPEYYFVSSRSVKEVARHGGALKGIVSPHVAKALRQVYGGSQTSPPKKTKKK